MPSLIGHSLAYEHATGQVLFSNLNFTIPEGGTALVGANGLGKSILARLMAGLLEPSAGSVKRHGAVLYFSQIAEAPPLIIAEYLTALWEAPAKRQTLITRLLRDIPLDQNLQTLSGGEWMRVRLSHALLQSFDFLFLDEPTNNLDTAARDLVGQVLKDADFSYLLISHDRHLLRQIDRIYELSTKGLQLYGGNFDFYREQKQAEKNRSAEKIQSAELNTKKRERERIEKTQAQEKRTRLAEKKAPDMGLPKIILGLRKRNAQKTTSKLKVQEDRLVDNSFEDLKDAVEAQKKEKLLYFDLPETEFPQGKQLLSLKDFNFRFSENSAWLWKTNINLSLHGPRRLALRGSNGRGKSTLLKLLLGTAPNGVRNGELILAQAPLAYLDQNYGSLDLSRTVFENVSESSRYDQVETRNLLARFLFQGEQVHQLASTLSGGERMRACLAKALFAKHAPQILILDEPTNNLDLESVFFLEGLLQQFHGALIVVSHDSDFLQNIGCEDELQLDHHF